MSLEDLHNYFAKIEYTSFLEAVFKNAKRYMKIFADAADQIELKRQTPRTEVEEFDEELNNFRLNNYERKEGPKPPEMIVNLLKRKL